MVVGLYGGRRAPPMLIVRLHDAVVTRAQRARVLHHPDHVLNIFLWNALILNIARLNFAKLRDKNPQTEVWIWIDSEYSLIILLDKTKYDMDTLKRS